MSVRTRFAIAMAVLAALVLPAVGGIAAAAAQDKFPSKPIEVVIPFSQGGGTDRVGRAFAQYAEKYLGVNLIPVNREGGSGAIGFKFGADARPDGYTITMVVTSLSTAPHTMDAYPVTVDDFQAICRISAPPAVLSVNSKSPIKDLKGLVEAAKKDPGKFVFGTSGVGSNTHLAGLVFADAAGIRVRYQPHKGSGPMLTAAYGNHIDVAITDAAEALPWIKDGRLRMLTVFGEQRFSALPDVPTSKEFGYAVDIGFFRALGVPKATPKPVLQTLINACEKTAKDKEFIEFLSKDGSEVNLLLGAEAQKWLRLQHDTYGKAAAIMKK